MLVESFLNVKRSLGAEAPGCKVVGDRECNRGRGQEADFVVYMYIYIYIYIWG